MKRLALLIVVACGSLALLRDRDAPHLVRPAATRARTTHEVPVAVEVSVSSQQTANVALAAKLALLARTEQDTRELEAELVAAPRREVLSRRSHLEQLLRERPELASAVARAFAKMDDREEAFVLSRALVLCADQPSVRGALLDAADGTHAARREVALLALASAHDERASELARRALDDTAAASTVRAAGAYALARDREQARSATPAARALAASPAEDGHLRAEALHLVAAAPDAADRALAATVLAEPEAPAEVALAAAHLALEAGEDRANVARALAARKDTSGLCARAARKLEGTP